MSMNIKGTITEIAIVLLVPAVIIIGYWQFQGGDTSGAATTPTSDLATKEAKVRDALAIIDQLRFDNSLFDIAAFKTLVDQTVPVTNEAIGRDDPFAVSDAIKSLTPTLPNSPSPQNQSQKTTSKTTPK